MDNLLSYLREMNTASLLVRLLLAMLSGGILGIERSRNNDTGDRTYMLVCVGAALAMLIGQYEFKMLTGPWAEIADAVGVRTDVSRFGAQIINGIGFLGAGTIIITGWNEIKGLTTTAGLWASACMGLAVGAGFYECAVPALVLIFLAMSILPRVEHAFVERSPYLNLYVKFDTLQDFGKVIDCLKEQKIKIMDVSIGEGNKKISKKPEATFSLKISDRRLHTKVILAVSELDGINKIEEM